MKTEMPPIGGLNRITPSLKSGAKKMVYFYDRQEEYTRRSHERSADFKRKCFRPGAVQCVTEVVSRLENPDYKKLYHAHGKGLGKHKNALNLPQYAAGTDVHSEDKLRVNRVVVNCDEFYKAFDITEKDGMWVAPAEKG